MATYKKELGNSYDLYNAASSLLFLFACKNESHNPVLRQINI